MRECARAAVGAFSGVDGVRAEAVRRGGRWVIVSVGGSGSMGVWKCGSMGVWGVGVWEYGVWELD